MQTPTGPTYLGIDLGTSAVKLLLVTAEGAALQSVSMPLTSRFPAPGWSEQDPEQWYLQTMEGLRRIFSCQDPGRLRGLSVGGQMHGLVTLDRSGRVLRPAILWNDGRTGEEVRFLNEDFGRSRLLAHTGNLAFAGLTAPKLLWMRRWEPALYRRICKIMLPKDYLIYRLTGQFTTDPSDASGTLLYDTAGRAWSPELLELCGLELSQLPTVFESCQPVGTLKPDLCKELGCKEVVVAAGAGDNAAAAVGTGTLEEGTCTVSLGTSGTVFVPLDQFPAGTDGTLHAFAHANGRYHLMGCMLCAAACSSWWSSILESGDHTTEESRVGALGKNRVFFLPYLMGERCPHNDEKARGAFGASTAPRLAGR